MRLVENGYAAAERETAYWLNRRHDLDSLGIHARSALPGCAPSGQVFALKVHGTVTIWLRTRREKYVAVSWAVSPKVFVIPPSYSLEISGLRFGMPKPGKKSSSNAGARNPSVASRWPSKSRASCSK